MNNARTSSVVLLGAAVALALVVLLPACNACERLEESLCKDLGAEDCALWKEAGGPEHLYGGRRANRACVNMSAGPAYDAVLTGAKAVASAQRAAKQRPPMRR